jgi:hypothetical protein
MAGGSYGAAPMAGAADGVVTGDLQGWQPASRNRRQLVPGRVALGITVIDSSQDELHLESRPDSSQNELLPSQLVPGHVKSMTVVGLE